MSLRFALSCALLGSLVTPLGGQAEPHQNQTGNAILPIYEVQHSAMRPLEAVTLVCSVTNANRHSDRSIAPGDEFTFAFGNGTLGACRELGTHSPTGSLSAGDFGCDVSGDALTLTYSGDTTPWPWSEGVHVELDFVAPPTSTVVAFGHHVARGGAYAPPHESVGFVSVSDRIGSVGPPGPAGPAGAAGAPGADGESAVGSRAMAVSSAAHRARRCDPPTLVPGLALEISTRVGARLVAHVDAAVHSDCELPGTGLREGEAVLHLEVNSEIVASQLYPKNGLSSATSSPVLRGMLSLDWLSDPLAEGTHSVRVLVEHLWEPNVPCREYAQCVGGAEGETTRARLVVLELPE